MIPLISRLSTTPRMIWSTRNRIANSASTAPTSPPASDPLIRPSQSTPTALATTAAVNAPSSSWPSIAMLITPARSPMHPARAPRISGIEAVSVPCSRLTTLTGMPFAQLPVSAHSSSEMTRNSSVAAMLSRLTVVDSSNVARATPMRIDAPPRT